MNPDPAYALDEGIRLLQANDFPGAQAALQTAVQHNPQEGRAYGYMGIAYARLGDMNASLWALQEAARLQPQDSTAHYNLAIGLMQAQRGGEARTALEYALQLNPENERARTALNSPGVAPPTAPNMPPAHAPDAPTSYPNVNGPGYAPSGSPAPGMSGMQYAPPQARAQAVPPSAGRRILRGLGWGALFGQWWTLWLMFSSLVFGGGRNAPNYIYIAVLSVIIFGILGSIMGLIIGAVNAREPTGAIIGIAFGLLLMMFMFFRTHSGTAFLNIIFWTITGRYIGYSIAQRVQRLVEA